MKIAQVDVFVLKTKIETPFAFSQGFVHQRAATLVRIASDQGLVGWGEAFTQGLEPPEIAAAAVEHALKPLLIGENPLATAVLWQKMYVQTRDYGRKGAVAAISAVDIALWDLAGHFYQQPIHQLLGGAFRKRVQPYATGFYRLKGRHEAARLAEESLQHRQAGFSAMKIKLGFGVDDDIKVMQAIHNALDDDCIALMVDSNHAYGRADALRLGKALAQYNLRWFEEPVVPEDIDGYVELRQKLTTPIAGGENEHTPYGFFQLLKAGALDIAQPDVGSCGGITVATNIVALAQSCGVAVNPHVWGSAIAQAASLQLIAALPIPHASLFATEPILEYDCSCHPFRQHLITEPWALDDGLINIPQAPGLGIEVRMDTIEKYKTH